MNPGQCFLKIKDKFPIFLFLFFSVYGLYLRFLKLSSHELWVDEYYTLGTMGGSFFDMLKAIPRHELSSYLSGDLYLIYPFFKVFGYSKWGLAIPHIIATILGFYFLYKICQRYFKTFIGYLVTFSLVCFNATMILHATEVRWYAVLPTLSVASFYFADKLVNKYDFLKSKQKILIGLFFIFVSWFHLYGVLMPYLSVAFSLFSKSKNKVNFRKIFRFMAYVFVIVIPFWLFCVLSPHLGTGAYLNMNTFQYIPNPLINIVGFLKSIFGNLVGYKMLYILLLGLFFPFLMWNKTGKRQITFLFIMVFLPITFLLVVDTVKLFIFVQRQFIWVMPLFAFYLGWSWDSLFVLLKRNSIKG